jgi:hypothetical protein
MKGQSDIPQRSWSLLRDLSRLRDRAVVDNRKPSTAECISAIVTDGRNVATMSGWREMGVAISWTSPLTKPHNYSPKFGRTWCN